MQRYNLYVGLSNQCMRNQRGETAQFSIRMPIDLKEQIEAVAQEVDLDVSTWIRHACREKLAKYTQSKETGINDDAIANAVEKYLQSQQYSITRSVSAPDKLEKKIIQRY